MKHIVWGILFGLVLLHQCGFAADDTTLVFGFLPIGLLFHACLSVAAGFAWFLTVKYAWPQRLELSLSNEDPAARTPLSE